jgi:hypothetical protein
MYENFSTDHRLTSATSSLNSGMAASSMVTSITPQMTTNKSIPPDRFLTACPIKYECRRLFVNLLEMEYSPQNQTIETILQYPDKRDETNFKNEKQHNDFMENVKKFAFPYVKTLASNSTNSHSTNSSQLVQFYTFVFTDENRIRQYGFCRSAQSGNHILCIVSYLPWYNVFISILNKISTIINEKEVGISFFFCLKLVISYMIFCKSRPHRCIIFWKHYMNMNCPILVIMLKSFRTMDQTYVIYYIFIDIDLLH